MNTQDHSNQATQKKALIARREFLKRAAIVGTTALGWPRSLFGQGTMEFWETGDPQCRIEIAAVNPAYELNRQMLASFIRLSEILTGVSPLDRNVAYEYLQRFATHPQLTSVLPKLIDAYRDITRSGSSPTPADVERRIMQDQTVPPGGVQLTVRDGAEQLIYLWYVSAFFLPRQDDPTKRIWIYGSPEQYERALLWSVIRAHAPMTTGGPYGYWADAPSA